MTDRTAPSTPPTPEPTRPPWTSGWTRVLLIVSVLLMVAGVGMRLAAGASSGNGEPVAAITEGGDLSDLTSGMAPVGDPVSEEVDDPGSETPGAMEVWSPTIFRLGFSFFVGFCIAYFLRVMMKIFVMAVGMMLILLFGLQYAGIIDVSWTRVEDLYDGFSGWLTVQTASFGDFIRGYLPSTASAGAGFVFGFRRKG